MDFIRFLRMYACSIVGKLWQCPSWDFFEAHTHSHRHTCICLYMSPICSWELSRPATAQSNWSVVPLAFWSVTISTASKVSAGNSEGQVPSKLCQQEYVLFSNLLKKKKNETHKHTYILLFRFWKYVLLGICGHSAHDSPVTKAAGIPETPHEDRGRQARVAVYRLDN